MQFFPSPCLKIQIKLKRLKKLRQRTFFHEEQSTMKLKSCIFLNSDQLQQTHQSQKFSDSHLFRPNSSFRQLQVKDVRKKSQNVRKDKRISLNPFYSRDIRNQSQQYRINKSTSYNTPKNKIISQRPTLEYNYESIEFVITRPQVSPKNSRIQSKISMLEMFRRTFISVKSKNIELHPRPKTSFTEKRQKSYRKVSTLKVRKLYSRGHKQYVQQSHLGKSFFNDKSQKVNLSTKIHNIESDKNDISLSPWETKNERNL